MHDLHDLAFATGEVDVAWMFHGVSAVAGEFRQVVGEIFRPQRIYSPSRGDVK
jgi:hypothetical protein